MNERMHLEKLANKIANLEDNKLLGIINGTRQQKINVDDEKDFLIKERKRIKNRNKKRHFTFCEWKKAKKLKINTKLDNKIYVNAGTQTIKNVMDVSTQTSPKIQRIEDIDFEFIEDDKENNNKCLQQ